jgi:hypothetical protein
MELKFLPGLERQHICLQDSKRSDWRLDLDAVGANSFVAWQAARPEFPASV